MEKIEYFVKEEDIRNPQRGEDVVTNLFKGKNPSDYIFVVDYMHVKDPIVTMSTGLIFQNFANKGLAKIIIRNHKHKDVLMDNPAIKMLINQKKLEVI